MSKAVISAQGIEKSFGPLHILKGLSIEVYEREIVAVVGASGTGKTTLLQILGTLDSPDGGSVRINGTDVVTLKGDEQARFRNKHIGFVFQFHQILPELTALENVAIPALIAGVSKKDAYAKAEELLRYLNMGERLHHKPAALSGGEKQRVAVGRALINNPTVILADEPSGALDKAHKEELHSLFLKLREEKGLTFVIVTHDDALTKIADRTVRLADGICQ
ncbi:MULTISPECIES: ABC transporter ATP-binding protein [Porphyromonas]|uniref:Lipoprotein ABC transporter ATP-binding protein n=1 Tax=Porphyromonas canoris TaxID=36875 RepID=A0ABR4XND6_9PORP|nr:MULTISPECIES: ABC transporter ATP-binding protein [Porphyromonas]KGN71884.1 lipoprotein ABC transporter ATP-binding protein [Porphyromonas sp. COT-108 OH1349]KGN92710.1 lipoprotein ABC transporter ATP-binding protein [Porphyromonas canoris]